MNSFSNLSYKQELVSNSTGDPSAATLAYLSYLKDMSKPENNSQILSWKKLNLSRAKLKASSRTSSLLSGFAMVAMVEVQLTSEMPRSLLIIFSICTTLLVSVHLLALMISTCILPHVEAVCSVPGISSVQDSPHERMHWYIEVAWVFSTVLGILLFMSEIAILCWVKFYNFSTDAALGSSIILIPFIVIFIAFATHFYRNLVTHKYERYEHGIKELDSMANQLGSENELPRNDHHIVDV